MAISTAIRRSTSEVSPKKSRGRRFAESSSSEDWRKRIRSSVARTLSKTALNPIASRTMFTAAVERAFHFTRPIHFVTRNLESTTATPGAGSLIVVNREGWALTCAHVVENLRKAVQVRAAFVAYRAELQAMGAPNKEARRELQKRHGLSKRTTSDAIVTMCGAGEGALSLNIITHGSLDLALVNFGRPID